MISLSASKAPQEVCVATTDVLDGSMKYVKTICLMPSNLIYEAASISCESNEMSLYNASSPVALKALIAFAEDQFSSVNETALWVKGMSDAACSQLIKSSGMWKIQTNSSCTGGSHYFCEFSINPDMLSTSTMNPSTSSTTTSASGSTQTS